MQTRRRIEAENLFHDGTRHLGAGDFIAAENCFRAAVALLPDFSEAHGNLGFVLDHQGKLDQAEACYRHALMLDPSCAPIHLNLGALLANQQRFEPAQAAYLEAIRCDLKSPAAWSNLGALYAAMKQDAEAEACLRRSLELDDSYAKARFNLSYVLLRQGRFEEGWACLEARDWYAALASHLACPLWQGESLAGKSLLIVYEAGHGDMIQFCRYAQLLKAQGSASITLLCHPALKTLLMTLAGVDVVLAFDEKVPQAAWDFWTPLMSLPHRLQTRADSIPAQIPYLHASPELVEKWRPMLPSEGLRVGLVWRGNPKFDNDAARSIPSLAMLAPLGTVAGVRFISLQKGAGEEEARQPPLALDLVDLGSKMMDFSDAAAIVSHLDLVICVDTAVAHLSGALGKPCWLMLPDYMADWRWLKDGVDSPWYPKVMRLFRHKQMGDWTSVIADVRTALQAFAAQRTGITPRLGLCETYTEHSQGHMPDMN